MKKCTFLICALFVWASKIKNNVVRKDFTIKRFIVIFILSLSLILAAPLNLIAVNIEEEEISPVVPFPQELIDIINGSDNLIDYYGIYDNDAIINRGSDDR